MYPHNNIFIYFGANVVLSKDGKVIQKMCNTNKRIRGCKPNPEIQTISFRDYVVDFCESQVNTRTVTCSVCGEDSLCTSATIDEDVVHGVFKCPKCNHKGQILVE